MLGISDWKLRTLVYEIMEPLREHGKRRQRNPHWKKFIGICKSQVGNQDLDRHIVRVASEMIGREEEDA